MALPSLAFPITPEHFSIEPLPWELSFATLDAEGLPTEQLDTIISLLDALEGDGDSEPIEEREGECDHEYCGGYGIDQSDPLGWRNWRMRILAEATRAGCVGIRPAATP